MSTNFYLKNIIFFINIKKQGIPAEMKKKKEEKGQSAISIDKYKIEDKV